MSDVRAEARKTMIGGLGIRAQLGRMIDRMLGRHRLAAAVFIGADGELTPAARAWMAQLARENFVVAKGFDPDPYIHAKNEGRRELALEILASAHLDSERLDELTRKQREIEDGR